MEGQIFIIVGLILDCAGALMITTSLLNLVNYIKYTVGPVERLNPDGTITQGKPPKNKTGSYTWLERYQSPMNAYETDTKKQNNAKCGIILLVIGFLSQIMGNILS